MDTFVAPETNRGRIQEDPSIDRVYEDFNLTNYVFHLSCKWSEDRNTNTLITINVGKCSTHVEKQPLMIGVEYYEAEGKQPSTDQKLDIQKWKQLLVKKKPSTIQLDFLLERFDPHYRADERTPLRHDPPVVLSTMERFTTILIENYKGAFPTENCHQVTLIPVSERKHVD